MNIQGANVLSMLSGAESVGNIQPGLLAETGDEAGFAAALLQQLGLLVSGDTADMATVQSLMTDPQVGEGLQNIAALFGGYLPASGTPTQDIDLDETLQTLADVMQQLQQLDAETSVADSQPVPLTDDIQDEQVAANDIDTAFATTEAALFMPLSTPVALESADEQTVSDLEVSALPPGEVKKPVALPLQDTKTENGATAVTTKPDELGVEFDRGIGTILAKEGSGDNLAQDNLKQGKSVLDVKSATELKETGLLADEPVGKPSPTAVAGDIARMAGAVRNEAGAALPANQASLQKHFAEPGWQQELGEKLVWMHKQNMPSVELRLNPEHLGPVLVKIDVSHDQATVAFTAQHLAVKEAIEAAIPKLREMLGNQQLNLSDVNVSQQQSGQRQSPREFFQTAGEQGQRRSGDAELLGSGVTNESQDIVDEIEAGRAIATNGLLSLFA